MSNFYEIAESLPFKAPASVNPSAKKKDIVENLIQTAIGSSGRVKDNKVFQGVVLYTIKIPEKAFKQKFWPDIVNYVFPKTSVKRGSNTNRVVNEHIVYIQELCGCLPRPPTADAKKFYEILSKMRVRISDPDGKESLKAVSGNQLDNQKAARYLDMINRYPRAYSLVTGTDTMVPQPVGTGIVSVKFPYEYDTSIGVVVPPKSQ
tara:strand:- start:169 stop:783 length:615 start_codon:yes stop_codon:yes gene_type:complete